MIIVHEYFSEECKYAVKKKKIMNAINEELNLDEYGDEFDNDNSKESDENEDCVLNGFLIFMDLRIYGYMTVWLYFF